MCDPEPAKGVADVIEDGVRVRIVRYTLPPGASTDWHVHALDYVIVPYGDCRVRVETRAGPIEAEMKADAPYFRVKGVEHDVVNIMDRPLSFLEIELK